MNKTINIFATVLILFFAALSVIAQVPARPDPPRLVNDFAGVLGNTQEMEDSLERIAMHTSNQICVVTMSDLGGMNVDMMAQAIGNEWGVGNAKNNNGVIILIKPNTQDSKGQVFIALGTGLESVISNAICTSIANDYMIPYFKENDYENGTWAGINEIYKLAIQKFNEPDFIEKKTLIGP